jgi:hypothetical protein
MPLLDQIIDRLDRRDVPRAKFPDARGNYWAHCPFHHDTHPTNFSVCEKGYVCFACGAKGGLRQLAEKLGIAPTAARQPMPRAAPPQPPARPAAPASLSACAEKRGGAPTLINPASLSACAEKRGGAPTIYSLAQYARDKQLPEAFLRQIGLSDRRHNQAVALRIPYRHPNGIEAFARYRIAALGDKFRWARGATLMLYGLERLDRSLGYVHLVEGESDCHTLWFHGEPALGVPGAATWKDAWTEHLAGLTVYIWQEPDAGGATLVKAVSASLPDARVIRPPEGRKDISDCHLHGDDVPALMAHLRATATDLAVFRGEQQAAQAEAARARAGSLLTHPVILQEFAALCRAQGLVGEERTVKLLYLAVTSRLLPRPISVAVKGPSSGGKSFTVETALKAFPPSAYYALTAMSDHALAYSEEPLVHRMLVLYEAAGLGGETATYLIRSLLSEGHIRYDTVEKTGQGLRGRTIDRPGPTGLIITTTAASLHPENETRLVSVTVRDTPGQTADIITSLAETAMGKLRPPVDFGPWHALQEWLELGGERRVVIPYAEQIAARAAKLAVRQRRDFSAVLNLVRSHALLQQASRPRDAEGRIVATLEDYEVAYELIIDVISEGAQASVKPEVRAAVEAVRELDQPDAPPVTYRRVAEALGIDPSAAQRRCQVALHDGYLVNRQLMRYRPAILGVGDPLPADLSVLPRPEELAATDARADEAAGINNVGASPPFSAQADRLAGINNVGASPPFSAQADRLAGINNVGASPGFSAQADRLPGNEDPCAGTWGDEPQASLLDDSGSWWDPDNC